LVNRPAHRSALASLYGSAVSGHAEKELCELESVIFVARTIGDADILLVGTADNSSAGGVERRPVYRLIASSAGPCGVAKTVLMADEDLVGSEGDR
jgi:hypothetical protein